MQANQLQRARVKIANICRSFGHVYSFVVNGGKIINYILFLFSLSLTSEYYMNLSKCFCILALKNDIKRFAIKPELCRQLPAHFIFGSVDMKFCR